MLMQHGREPFAGVISIHDSWPKLVWRAIQRYVRDWTHAPCFRIVHAFELKP